MEFQEKLILTTHPPKKLRNKSGTTHTGSQIAHWNTHTALKKEKENGKTFGTCTETVQSRFQRGATGFTLHQYPLDSRHNFPGKQRFGHYHACKTHITFMCMFELILIHKQYFVHLSSVSCPPHTLYVLSLCLGEGSLVWPPPKAACQGHSSTTSSAWLYAAHAPESLPRSQPQHSFIMFCLSQKPLFCFSQKRLLLCSR